MIVPPSRLLAYTAAISIEASSIELISRKLKGKHLEIKLFSDNMISIGGNGLCYSDNNLIKVIKTGFALPQFLPFLKNFKNGCESLYTLLAIKKIFSGKKKTTEKVAIGLRAGINSTATFANFDSQSVELLSDYENVIIKFIVKDSDISFFLNKFEDKTWDVTSQCPNWNIDPSAVMIFSNLSIAERTLVTGFDYRGEIGRGSVLVSGNLPLLDKIGYISRKVQIQLPSFL
jgi:hypothetical protein